MKKYIFLILVIIFICNCKNKVQPVDINTDPNDKIYNIYDPNRSNMTLTSIEFSDVDPNYYPIITILLSDTNRPVHYEYWKDGNIYSKLLFHEDKNYNIKKINHDLDPDFIIQTLWIFIRNIRIK